MLGGIENSKSRLATVLACSINGLPTVADTTPQCKVFGISECKNGGVSPAVSVI
jgi:hypothetical protein